MTRNFMKGKVEELGKSIHQTSVSTSKSTCLDLLYDFLFMSWYLHHGRADNFII